jgi:hypothetical protein
MMNGAMSRRGDRAMLGIVLQARNLADLRGHHLERLAPGGERVARAIGTSVIGARVLLIARAAGLV